ncbi:recombinase family protein [Pseudoflavonifractor capillosus]|uniref:recombinase family protein n=1 Tax=Pseudoflavonifractor capillosus TaxID=106588 RepID=UPI001957A647|nr:recombinase family protein [Pseudoflavonifractor capillosus]MBM6896380.1 recombinase family protein [Pseudoflavonifractor capillosus]
MISVASYCRVSTDKEDQANSFAAQQRYFTQYISAHPQWQLYRVYADQGITGTSANNRPQFQQMIQDAQNNKFQMILTKEVSRFSRNLLDTIAYTRMLKSLGIFVIFLTDGINTQEPDAELRLSIMASIAQEESRKTSARVKWGQTRQMERGVVFGRSMLGYDVTGGKIFVNPAGAQLVQRIFHMYGVEKLSTTQIARTLSQEGVHTCSGNPHWHPSYIIKILKNEKYVGDLIQKKSYTPDYLTHQKKSNHGEEPLITLRNHHTPIISRALWTQVQQEIKRRGKRAQSSHSVHHTLSGKIICGACGKPFVARQRRAANGSVSLRWSCATAARFGSAESSGGCSIGRLLRDDDAKQMVVQALASLELNQEAIVSSITALMGKMSEPATLAQWQAEKIHLCNKKEAVMDAYFSGNITAEEMQKMKAKYQRQIDVIQDRLDHQSQVESHVLMRKAMQEAASILAGEIESDAWFKTLVDSITVYPDRHLELRLCQLPHIFYFQDEIR